MVGALDGRVDGMVAATLAWLGFTWGFHLPLLSPGIYMSFTRGERELAVLFGNMAGPEGSNMGTGGCVPDPFPTTFRSPRERVAMLL
jgi:hypothetical protein